MSNTWFRFKQFIIHQDQCAMKVTTDASLFGAWVANQILQNDTNIDTLLDLGTGTGLLSLMIAQKNPELKISAIEIDKAATNQAKENVKTSKWADRISIIEGDARIQVFTNRFDCIVSNPPFYENELRSPTVGKNLAHHSDELNLSEVLDFIKNSLAIDGCFFLLLPYKRDAEIRKLLLDRQYHIEEICFVRQTPVHDYFRVMIKSKAGNEKNSPTVFNDITIMESDQQYSIAFSNLLQDYYLKL